MEQQDQRTLQKAAPEQEQKHSETVRKQEASSSGWAVQAILNGVSLWDLPQKPLEELAERIGNSSMLALASMQMPTAATRQEELVIGPQPMTAATEVPQTMCQLAPVQELTTGTWPTASFDPGSLG